ncbi:MAG TPA: cytochrome c peroxidase [Longimicrobiales bacterium]|nr:cytochrome c peroxidase [Longimicrobiales bacterium]
MIRLRFLVGALALAACSGGGVVLEGAATQGASYRVPVPLGLDLVAPVPEDNAVTTAKVSLGRTLFFDPTISVDGTRSCASCHRPELYFTDGRRAGVGVEGREGIRNVPSIVNAAYGSSFLWDGRVETLEEQMLRPIAGEDELDLEIDALVARLQDRAGYRRAFRRAFGTEEVSGTRIAHALASYVRTLRSGAAPVDRFLHGEAGALGPDAREGFRLFVGRANCGVCHLAPLFTDHSFHNTGVSWGASDRGRFAVTGEPEDRGAFKTPSLRNVARTAPYMHDGSIRDLAGVIDHYDRGGTPNPYLDPEIEPLGLTSEEKRQLLAFLESLTGEVWEGNGG